jgi:hypothetical protein
VTYREIGYGGETLEHSLFPAQLELPRSTFLWALGEPYADLVADTRRDAEDGFEPDPMILHELSYPVLNELAEQHPDVVSELVVEYLAEELLAELLTAKRSEAELVVNELTRVDLGPELVTLHTLAFRIR